MTEAERIATEQMRKETAPMHPGGKVPGTAQPATPHGTPAEQTKESGTHVLPMPQDSGDVAGMPREKRVHSHPGDPGNPAPEAQVVTGATPAKPSVP
ncbi:MAG: hypothetical protein WC590_00520 [Burkholderiaceae bacterium]